METQEKPNLAKSNSLKLFLLLAVVLVLLIPLEYVKNLIAERHERKNEVTQEIGMKWGKDVKFFGPIIKIPFQKIVEQTIIDEKTKIATLRKFNETKYAYFFPDLLESKGVINNQKLERSIYQVSVFNANMLFEGNFGDLDFSKSDINIENIQWEKATVIIKTSNLKSIKNQIILNINNKKIGFEPIRIFDNSNYELLETNFINLRDNKNLIQKFSFKISYDGSKKLMFVPIGKNTKINIQSNWKDPSFEGYFLPENDSKKISDKGFEARWNISHINRAFSQQYFENIPNLDEYLFGVNFIIPVDEYQKNERASKYGFLVIGLTFLVFFLIQTTSKIEIYLFNYTMIGVALVLFYTLLISITEHSSFALAYLLASISVITLLSWYAFQILRKSKFVTLIMGSLATLYLFIYVIIQLEEYALLAGSIGLFVILTLVMYFSKKIEWNR
jgi:inner membrane protein